MKEIINRKFGMLTVLEELPRNIENKYRGKMVRAICDCGKIVDVKRAAIICGRAKSCGNHKGYYARISNIRHGLTRTPLYHKWISIKTRCYCEHNNNFKYYGAKGIKMCEEWRGNFLSFYNWAESTGFKEGLHIDRIDVYGNYEPQNCRWVTLAESNANKSTTKKYFYNGESMILKKWATKLGINYRTLHGRMRRGFTIKEAIETKIRKSNKRTKN